jgi:hypothetical protein
MELSHSDCSRRAKHNEINAQTNGKSTVQEFPDMETRMAQFSSFTLIVAELA